MFSYGTGVGLFTALTTLLQQIICPQGYSDVRTEYALLGMYKANHNSGEVPLAPFCKFLLPSLNTTSYINVHSSCKNLCKIQDATAPMMVKIRPFKFHIGPYYIKLYYFALVLNKMNQHKMKGFIWRNLNCKSPYLSSLVHLRAILWNVTLSYRLFRTTEQNPLCQNNNSCDVITLPLHFTLFQRPSETLVSFKFVHRKLLGLLMLC